MCNWSVLVHQAAMHHYRPGQEDTTRYVLSSVQSDAGVDAVIREPQADPAVYRVREARVPARLFASVRHWVATMPSGISDRLHGRLA